MNNVYKCKEFKKGQVIIKFKKQTSGKYNHMITLKRNNSDEHLEASDAYFSANDKIHMNDERDYEKQVIHHEDKADLLRKIIVKTKMKRIKYAFIEKVMRRVDTDDEIMLKLWKNEEQRQISKPSIEGMVYPQEFQHLLQVLNLFCFPLLIILTSFLGFLDDFASHYSKNQITIIIKIFCFVVIILRFIVKSTSVTFSGGEFKLYLKQIIIAYYDTSRMLFDFVLIILQLINLFFPEDMVIAAVLFFYLNIMMIYPGNDTIRTEAAYIQSKRTALFWALFKIIFFNVFFAHFMGTVILAMAKIEPERSWMVRAGIQEKEWYIKYVFAYYWGTTIMMTVGFGDVLPGSQNWREVIMTSFLEMFSCIVLGYNISSIGNIVSKLRDADEKVNRRVVVFERMMRRDRKKNVSINPLLQRRISNYLQELRIDKENLEYEQRDQLLSQLPQNLRRAYFKQANRRIFASVMFFNQLKPKTLEVFAQKFKSIFFNAGQYLSHSNQVLILQHGKIGLGYRKKGSTKNGVIMQQIQIGEKQSTLLINGAQFLTSFNQPNYYIIAKQNSMVWSLTQDQLIDTLSQSMIDLQYYFSLIHKHPIDENQWEFIQCERCSFGIDPESVKENVVPSKNKIYHSSFKCAKLTYLPVRGLISYFYCSNNGSVQNQRVKSERFKSTFSLKHTFEWRKILKDENQKQNIGQSIKRSQKNSKKPIIITATPIKVASNIIKKITQSQNTILNLDQLKLKKLIRQVMMQHETGYEEGYWSIECDSIHDYQFYFPQQNPNRLNMTPIGINPFDYERNHRPNRTVACRLKSLVRTTSY